MPSRLADCSETTELSAIIKHERRTAMVRLDVDGRPVSEDKPVGTVTLIGSGEMTESMGRVHRAIMARIAEPVRAVFLDTPAGFQLNADDLSARAVRYFEQRLGVSLSVATFKSAAQATPAVADAALSALREANYIFAGPGSPSYAARQWLGSPLAEALGQRLAAGAHIVLASSAAIAASRHALPVYEIYKVGQEPHWVAGVDLLGPYGLDLAIVPHWNNQEGGTHDTRYAYMGEPRLRLLEAMLPDSAVILGVDEYSACIVDLNRRSCQVMGAGGVTVRQKGRERSFSRGSRFSVEWLIRGPGADVASLGSSQEPETDTQPLVEPRPTEQPPDECETPSLEGDLINLLVDVRAQLRRDRQWALADEIRHRLAEIGITLEDGRDQTSWRKAKL